MMDFAPVRMGGPKLGPPWGPHKPSQALGNFANGPKVQKRVSHVRENNFEYPFIGAVGATPPSSLSKIVERKNNRVAPKVAPDGPNLGPPPRHREDLIQFAVSLVLDALGVLWCHVPNEALERGGAAYGTTLVGLGVKSGVPDVLIFDRPPARPAAVGAALELKTLVGSPSDSQRRWVGELGARGWEASVEKGLRATLQRLEVLGWDVRRALAQVREKLGWELAPDGERMVRVTKGRKA